MPECSHDFMCSNRSWQDWSNDLTRHMPEDLARARVLRTGEDSGVMANPHEFVPGRTTVARRCGDCGERRDHEVHATPAAPDPRPVARRRGGAMIRDRRGGYPSTGEPLTNLPKVPAGPAPGAPPRPDPWVERFVAWAGGTEEHLDFQGTQVPARVQVMVRAMWPAEAARQDEINSGRAAEERDEALTALANTEEVLRLSREQWQGLALANFNRAEKAEAALARAQGQVAAVRALCDEPALDMGGPGADRVRSIRAALGGAE